MWRSRLHLVIFVDSSINMSYLHLSSFMKRLTFLTFILTLSLFSVSQNSIKGFVFDKKGNPIEFCSISINDKGIGTYSDKEGYFSVVIDGYEQENILFTHIAYLTQEVGIKKYVSQNVDTIYLEKSSVNIEEVVINPEEYKKVKHRPKRGLFGKYNRAYAPAVGAITAYHLKDYTSSILSEVTFYYKRIKNPNIYVGLRVLKKTDKPQMEDRLLDTNLVYNLKLNSKSLTIDLKEYNIVIPSEGVLVGLELIRGPCKKKTVVNDKITINSCFYIGLENSLNSENTYVSQWNKKWSWWKKVPKDQKWNYDLMLGYEILVPKEK